MLKHLKYLNYIIKHKWFVLVAGWKLGIRPLQEPRLFWRLLIHDWSKFLPSEWFPYVEYFYGEHPDEVSFNRAWGLHQMRNDHHWQNWATIMDEGTVYLLPMSGDTVSEMLADWMGAGRAIHGRWEVSEWYQANKDNILLHPRTRDIVEMALSHMEPQNEPRAERVKPRFVKEVVSSES